MQLYSIFHLILEKIEVLALIVLILAILYLVIKESIRNNKKAYYSKHYRTQKEIQKAIQKEQEKTKKIIER